MVPSNSYSVASSVYVFIKKGLSMSTDMRVMWYLKRLGIIQVVDDKELDDVKPGDKELKDETPEQCKVESLKQCKVESHKQCKTESPKQCKVESSKQCITESPKQCKVESSKQCKAESSKQYIAESFKQCKAESSKQCKIESPEQCSKLKSTEQCKVMSFVPRDEHALEEDGFDATSTFVMDAFTRVYFLTPVNNMVYCLDMSPSNCSVVRLLDYNMYCYYYDFGGSHI